MRKSLLVAVVVSGMVGCQSQSNEASSTDGQTPAAAEKSMAAAPGTPEAKIASALSAGPESITANAAVVEWSFNPAEKPTTLREGTNGWTCFVDLPNTPDPDAVCADQTTAAWFDAFLHKTPPKITTVGLAYMLVGDSGASETDPWAEGPTPDNKWHKTGPHTMVFVPDPKQLDGITSDHTTGGPYVMWKGTPYAHIMMPVAAPK
jgi:hypothetical protein